MQETPAIRLAFQKFELPTLALSLMLVAVVLPSALYSYRLTDPTPPELLVAICVALFSSVVFLWILDAVAILRFRSEWVSKSIYGAAIASVLGTSVAVYKDAFTTIKYPYEGGWNLQITSQTQGPYGRLPVLIMFSERSGAYWGYSEFRPSKETPEIVWAEIANLSPTRGAASVSVRLSFSNGQDKFLTADNLRSDGKAKSFQGILSDGSQIRISRPN